MEVPDELAQEAAAELEFLLTNPGSTGTIHDAEKLARFVYEVNNAEQ